MKSLCLLAILTLVVICELTWAADDIEYTDLSKCPVQVQPMGCYRDNDGNRALPKQILNSRDPGSTVFMEPNLDKHWGNFPAFLSNFVCQCAKKALKEKRGEYIGIQYFAECWSNEKDTDTPQSESYKKYSEDNSQCIDSSYAKYDGSKSPCGVYAGKQQTNYVYKITELNQEVTCPLYFKPMGCYKDNQVKPRPLPEYIMNERDYTLPNWNGHMIEWNRWDQYMPELICRCAMAAKKGDFKYFGIQFYGECWAGNEQNELKKDGEANDNKCLVKLGAPPYGQNCPSKSEQEGFCHPQLCVGIQQTNYVYELLQGPGPCSKNPCKPDETCIPNGAKYSCEKSPFEEKDPSSEPEKKPSNESTELNEQKPASTEPTNEKPASTEPNEQKPAPTEHSNEKPASTESANEKPTPTEHSNEKPASAEATNEKPVSTEPINETPASSEPTNEKPTSTEPSNEKPASTKPTNESPASTEPTNEKPASTEPTNEKPASTKPIIEKAASTEPNEQRPAHTEHSNEKPASTESANEKPTPTEHSNEKPASTEPTNEKPASTEPIIEKPASTEPNEQKPASTEPANEKPASTEPTNEKPASTEPIIENPASTEPTNEKPASTEPTNEKPTSTIPTNPQPTQGNRMPICCTTNSCNRVTKSLWCHRQKG